MKRISIVLCVCGTLFFADRALAQCQGGGGGGSASSGTATAATGTTAVLRGANAGAALLTGQGSLAYDMMRANAMRQQLAQYQMMRPQQKQAERQATLAKRQYNAEKSRLATAERRERMRQFIAAQNGDTKALAQRNLLASNQSARR